MIRGKYVDVNDIASKLARISRTKPYPD